MEEKIYEFMEVFMPIWMGFWFVLGLLFGSDKDDDDFGGMA